MLNLNSLMQTILCFSYAKKISMGNTNPETVKLNSANTICLVMIPEGSHVYNFSS